MAALLHPGKASVLLDQNETIVACNASWSALCGYTLSQVKGKRTTILQGPNTNLKKASQFAIDTRTKGAAKTILCNYDSDGQPFAHRLEAKRITDLNTGSTFYVVEGETVSDPAIHRAILNQEPVKRSDRELAWAVESVEMVLLLAAVMSAAFVTSSTLV